MLRMAFRDATTTLQFHQHSFLLLASLLRGGGVALEEAARIVLEATRTAVSNNPQWNWRKEHLTITSAWAACDFRRKKPELASPHPTPGVRHSRLR